MAKEKPQQGKLNVKGLGNVVKATNQAARANAVAVQRALQKAGVNHLTVIVPRQTSNVSKKRRK